MGAAGDLMVLILGVLVIAVIIVGGVLVKVALKVTENLATEEARGWLDTWSKGLIHEAVERLPERARERYHEEWRAELAELLRNRPIGAFVWAMMIWAWGSRALARQLGAEAAPSTAAGFGGRRAAVALVAAVVRARHKFVSTMTPLRQALSNTSRSAMTLGGVIGAVAVLGAAIPGLFATLAPLVSALAAVAAVLLTLLHTWRELIRLTKLRLRR